MAVQAFDRSVLKVGQAFIIGLNVIAFALGFVLQLRYAWLLVPLVAVIMLAGVVNPSYNLFRQFYLRVLKPAGVVKPNVVQEDATPHQFAQGVGGAFLLAATASFVFGAITVGGCCPGSSSSWRFLNFAFDICVGCQMYFQLDRMHMLPRRG